MHIITYPKYAKNPFVGTSFRIENRYFQFIHKSLKRWFCQIWWYSFKVNIKVVRNVILNNIDINDQPFRMHRSPPRSRQNFPDSKNSKIYTFFTDISDLIIESFDRDESCQKWYSKQPILFCTVLPPGASKIHQTFRSFGSNLWGSRRENSAK